MPTYNIPKQARNKYGYVKGEVAGSNYITQQQIMMTSGGTGGNGGGNSNNQPSVHSQVAVSQQLAEKGVGPEDTIVTDSYANAYFATATYLTTYYVSKTDLTTASYVTSNELSACGYIDNNTLSQASYVTQQALSGMSYTTTTMVDEKLQDYATSYDVSTMIDATKSYADNKASSDSAAAKNASYYYTDTSVSGLRTDIVNTLSYFAWPCDVVKTDYTFGDMPVNTIRPVLINSSTTVNITTPGDSHQSFVLLLFNVITSVLVSAGKNPRYIAVTGGTTTQITWTSNGEPFMLCFLIRTE